MTEKIEEISINFGPQHPAAHGVLRLILDMDGEIIKRADPHRIVTSRYRKANEV